MNVAGTYIHRLSPSGSSDYESFLAGESGGTVGGSIL
jgi:hypothetical protein